MPNWTNLLSWLKAHYDNAAIACGPNPEKQRTDRLEKAAVPAFGIVKKLSKLPWKEIEGVLEDFRNGIAAENAAWAAWGK